jgi:hypothetical protein
MATVNQTGILAINDQFLPGLINSTDISFSQGKKSVQAVISFTGQYTDDSPVFDFFIQNQPGTIKLSFGNIITVEGATSRTISFNNAICRDYRESYDRQKQFDDFVEILIVFTIEADNAAMGGTNFPG